MIKALWVGLFFGIVTVVSLFLPVVTELPLGIDEALVFFIGTISALTDLMPPLAVVWERVLWGLGIMSLFLAWHFIKMGLDWIR